MPIDPATAALVGSFMTNAANFAMGERQNRFSRQMSNTAHQRQAEDLRRAGINPLLGAGGVGASSPVGSQVRFEDSVGKSISTGMQAAMQKKQLELLTAQIQKEYSQAQLNNAHNTQVTTLTTPQSNHLNAQTALLNVDTETKRKVIAFVAQHMNSEIARNLASAWQSQSGGDVMQVERILKSLQVNHAENLSKAEEDWFFRNLGPYLHSAGQFGNVGKAAGAVFKAGEEAGKTVFGAFEKKDKPKKKE